MEIRDLLNEYEFPGDDTPIIKGSAYVALMSDSKDPNAPEYACIHELMDAVDEFILVLQTRREKLLLQVLRCSERLLTMLRQATT